MKTCSPCHAKASRDSVFTRYWDDRSDSWQATSFGRRFVERLHSFGEVYTNDRHMLQAARYFHVAGVDVLSDSA